MIPIAKGKGWHKEKRRHSEAAKLGHRRRKEVPTITHDELENIHFHRSKHARRTDLSLKAKTRAPDKERYLDEEDEMLVESWVDAPERMDVEGIDTPKNRNSKKHKKKATTHKHKSSTGRKTEPRWWHGINKNNLQRHYKKLTGLSLDTYDWDSLDKSLTYSEAKKQIEREVGGTERKITGRELRELDEQQLYSRHGMRTEHAQVVDEHRIAKKVFKKEDPKTERWLKHPERFDVEGIDDSPKE